MRKLKQPEQISRFDGKSTFLEITTQALPINQIHLGFNTYDNDLEQGEKITNEINIYLNPIKAYLLSRDIFSGKLEEKANQARKIAREKNTKYIEEVYLSRGGSDAEVAKRADRKPESRQFKIIPGNKQPWVLNAISGPATKGVTGLYIPDYGMKPEKSIMVGFDNEGLREFAATLEIIINAWSIERICPIVRTDMENYRKKVYEEIKKKKEKNNIINMAK